MTTETTREQIVRLFVEDGTDEATVLRVLESMDPEKDEALLASLIEAREEKDAFRARLGREPYLMHAVCPDGDWKDAGSRYDVARRATRLVESAAEQGKVTVEALCAALIAGHGTVQDTIDLHGDDPRTVQWGNSFYAFRWRLRDAIEVAAADRLKAEKAARDAAQDARWKAQGLVRCGRCFGAGGRKDWPGFSCFDCDGRGAVDPEESRRQRRRG